jgi:cytoskeletal protein RodZ
LPLLIAVAVGLLFFVLRRALFGRRLTIEQSVDRHRRTLSAVHDAASRARESDGAARATGTTSPTRPRRSITRPTRWQLAVALMVVATVATTGIVIAQNGGSNGADRSAPTTTTRPPPTTHPTTTTRPAPTTTVALVTATGATGTDFTIAKPTYTLIVQTTSGDCWVDARDPAGTSLFSGTLLSGQSQSITGSTFTLRLGNPAAVTLSVDGKPVPFSLAGGSSIGLHFVGSTAR